MKDLVDIIKLHGTKLLGFLGLTLGVLAAADPSLVGGDRAVKYYLLGISLLNVWRGFFTSDAFKMGLVLKDENTEKANAIIRDGKQSGFITMNALAHLGAAMVILLVVLGFMNLLIGCVSTQAAYKAAPLHGETMVDTAYVFAEHYDAILVEANALKDTGRIPAGVLETMRAVDRKASKVFLGDPATSRPGLRQLRDTYIRLHDAKSEAELQQATNEAARLLSDLINAVNAARGK